MDVENFDPPIIDFDYFIDACKKGILANVKESLTTLAEELGKNKEYIINYPDENYTTGYMHAVYNNNLEVIRYFIKNYYCNNFYINIEGSSALLIAIEKELIDCLKYILLNDNTIKKIIETIDLLDSIYLKKKKIYVKLDDLLTSFGQDNPNVIKLFLKLEKLDKVELKFYRDLNFLHFEQIILCFKNSKNSIILSLLNNTFGSYEDLEYIYDKIKTGEVM